MKTILCYGDSNTWGFVPGTLDLKRFYMERYPQNTRWTGIIQKTLGSEYLVIEEGLNGRTTNIDYKQESIPGVIRNGKVMLSTCLYTHAPIHLVILMLGVNDLKIEFNRTNEEIAKGMNELIDIIQRTNFGKDMQSSPQILVIGNPMISNEEKYFGMFKGSINKLKELNTLYKTLAKSRHCHFADASEAIVFSEIDGIHLDEKGHQQFAIWIHQEITKIFK